MQHQNIPWIEKYRPKMLDDIISQDDTKNMFMNSFTLNNLPHLLLYGPPGTGKTTSILVVANMLFGPRKINERILELNASDDRGINVVRTKILNFARESLGNPDAKYPSPPFKIIILDEADAMTKEAQSALKKIMETYSKITRFCLICNYITKIIDPIQSRCSKLRFKSISIDLVANKLEYIAKKENMRINIDAIKYIANESNGDMRRSIMHLQKLSYLMIFKNNHENNTSDALLKQGESADNKHTDAPICIDDILSIANKPSPTLIQNIIDICIDKSTNINIVINKVNDIWKQCFDVNYIFELTLEKIMNSSVLSNLKKEYIIFNLSRIERDLLGGADEFIQLCYLFSMIHNVNKNKEDFKFDYSVI